MRARPPGFRHPAQVLVTVFAAIIGLGTVLLLLPVSRAGEQSAGVADALFTATSAVCVTGLVTVDTPSYWSVFGQVVILGLIQVGGFGIMTLASLLGLLVVRRMGLRTRLSAATERKSLGLGDVRTVLLGVARVSLLVELVTAALLSGRFLVGYDMAPRRAVWLGVFHAVSAFNNAGFALWSDSLTRFVTDPWVCLPVALAVIIGGLGFPVLLEVTRGVRPVHWTLHARMTLTMTAILLIAGTAFIAVNEWDNPATLGSLDTSGRWLATFFHGVMPRTAGFNTLDVGAMKEGTWLGTIVLMFVGGGSAGTAGGIKVTTFALLFFVIWAEVRGEGEVNAFHRRVDPRAQRQALTVALLAVGAVVGATLVLLEITDYALGEVLFEVVSAFGTVGLSTGITAGLPDGGQLLLAALMFLGRLGPITLVSALALRERQIRYSLPTERPIIG